MTAALALGTGAQAALVGIATHTDSNGYFRYTLAGGDEAWRWGGAVNMLSVRLPALGILAVETTPGWTWDTNEADVICWRYAGTNALVLDDGSVALAYTSAYPAITLYDELSLTGLFQRATIAGEVYDTNRVLYTSRAPDTNSVVSVNVAGYERVAFAGPMIPEPGAAAGLLWMLTIYNLQFSISRRWREK